MVNFDFLKKGLGIVSPPHFMCDFSRKTLLKLYSINLTKFYCLIAFTSWDIGQYMYCNCLLCCDVVNFEINLIFLIKPFSYMNKKSREKFKYLENEKSFEREIKSVFHHI